MSVSYFSPLKPTSLEELRVVKSTPEGRNFLGLGFKPNDFLLREDGDYDTHKHMSAARAITASPMILGRAFHPSRTRAARVTCRAADASSAPHGGARLGEGWTGWPAGVE